MILGISLTLQKTLTWCLSVKMIMLNKTCIIKSCLSQSWPSKIPKTVCRGNQGDANFHVGLQKYVIPSPLYFCLYNGFTVDGYAARSVPSGTAARRFHTRKTPPEPRRDTKPSFSPLKEEEVLLQILFLIVNELFHFQAAPSNICCFQLCKCLDLLLFFFDYIVFGF